MLATTIDSSILLGALLFDALLVTALIPLNIWPKLAHTSADSYGGWFIEGATCPIAVQSCSQLSPQKGCGLNVFQHRTALSNVGSGPVVVNKIGGTNIVAPGEPIMGTIYSVGGVLNL